MKKVKMKYKETEKISKEVIKEILRVEKEKGLTAENLLEEARDEKSSLHKLFDWNNNKAGEKWRFHQARLLINEVKVIIDQQELYAFESVNINTSNLSEEEIERVYKPVVEILNNEDLRIQVIKTAMEKQKYWKQQYSIYDELKSIVISIEKTEKSLDKKWLKKKA